MLRMARAHPFGISDHVPVGKDASVRVQTTAWLWAFGR